MKYQLDSGTPTAFTSGVKFSAMMAKHVITVTATDSLGNETTGDDVIVLNASRIRPDLVDSGT